MYKSDIIDYVSQSKRLKKKQGGNGANNLLAEILDVSPATISQLKELIPIKKAMQLHNIFNDKDKLKEFGLTRKGAPRFDINLYE